MKEDILKELDALATLGMREVIKAAERVRAGEFDDDIDELVGISCTEATDLIIDLSAMR